MNNKPNWSSGQLYHQTDEINASYQEEQQEEYYPTEETQWIEETQQEFEEDNYEHENYTSLMEQSEITEEEPISCIKLNTNTSSKLPHIFLPEINAKFLVDTGSSRSMVSNEKVKEYFCEYLIYEPFTIQTAHATTRHDYTIDIHCLKTFKAPHESFMYLTFPKIMTS
ncbi:hypothetical protein QE152_g35901 [Popillia japonica]|uniref:Uncharacterized protein n=1 Tax=Popillia japonica TaxID=7064 RepID=A0AAW1IEW7_POPJA